MAHTFRGYCRQWLVMSGGAAATVLERVAGADETIPPQIREADVVTDEQVSLERHARERFHEARSSVSETVPAPVFERRSFRSAESLPPSTFRSRTETVLDSHDRTPCGDCGGRGERICGTCSGQGRRTCPSCGGSRNVTVTEPCSNCGGDGSLRSTETCSTCQGRGERRVDGGTESCPDCDGGRVEVETTCRECGGSGSFERTEACTRCDEDGRTDCGDCADGTTTCGGCDGSGELVEYTGTQYDYTVEVVAESFTGPGSDTLVDELSPDDLDAWTIADQSVETDVPGAALARDLTQTASARHIEYRFRGEPHHAFVVGDRVLAPDAPEITPAMAAGAMGSALLQFLPMLLMAGAVGAFFLTDIRPLYLGAVFFGSWGVLLYDPFGSD